MGWREEVDGFEIKEKEACQGPVNDDPSVDSQIISTEGQENRESLPKEQNRDDEVQILAPSMSSGEMFEKADIFEKANTQNECTIARGRCTTHNILARKIVTSTKKWGKKKDGFGWIYRKSVNSRRIY